MEKREYYHNHSFREINGQDLGGGKTCNALLSHGYLLYRLNYSFWNEIVPFTKLNKLFSKYVNFGV